MKNQTTRRDFLKMAGATAASVGALSWLPGCATAGPTATAKMKRPNFVFILIDDMGWKDLGCYGASFFETPNIDRLAAQGMRFTDAYAACAVCTPTRASILTGKYPARLHMDGHIRPDLKPYPQGSGKLINPQFKQWLEPSEETIAEALKTGGYISASIGKWHLGEQSGPQYRPQNQGFSRVVLSQHHGFYPFVNRKKWPYAGPLPGKPGDYLPDRLTDEAVKFIEDCRERPFFLYLSHWSVHGPFKAKKDKIRKYEAKKKAQGEKHINPVYAAMVESADESVGRVMKKLAETGLAERTVVIFMSDNGGVKKVTSMSPLRGQKSWYYEGGIRVPLIIKAPGLTRPGSLCNEPVISTDFYPTMLEIAGLPSKPEQHRDGVSLVPLLKSGDSLGRDAIYWHFPLYHFNGGTPCSAMRAGDYKLIEYFEDYRVELYNLRNDIGEKKDLSKTNPHKAEELREMLHRWREEVNAQIPKPNPDYDPNKRKRKRKKR
ncbi:MAG: sulfatase-like hydrolase/transferase [Planctomycetota bacterium]|jgi:arylsulfatase A-like enzyme